MFKPMFATNRLKGRVVSLYKSSIALNSGALVDIDLTDTSAVNKSIGYEILVAGSLKLATIVAAATQNELGISIATVNAAGVPILERLLGIGTNFMTLPFGLNVPVYQPVPGDIIATSEFVGNDPIGDVGTTGFIDITTTGNYGADVGIFAGKFRLKQVGDAVRAQFLHKTTANGVTLAVFKFR